MGEFLPDTEASDPTGFVDTGLDTRAFQLAATARTAGALPDSSPLRGPNMLIRVQHTDAQAGVAESPYAVALRAMTGDQALAWLTEPVQGKINTPNMLIGEPDGTQPRN